MIGLREKPSEAAVRAYDPLSSLARWHVFGDRYGMPFTTEPKPRPSGTGRGCRAVVAAGLDDPGSEWTVFRALQTAYFTTVLLLDDAESIRSGLADAAGIDAAAVAARVDHDDVVAEYERQRAQARSAEGTPAHAQSKTTVSDGLVRYTAPSVLFRRGGGVAHAGGWQPLLSYETLLANFAPELERTAPPGSPEPLFEYFSHGLTTGEVALLLAHGSDPIPDRSATQAMLGDLEAAGRVTRTSLGNDALWSAPAG
jgi:hypothetical protein